MLENTLLLIACLGLLQNHSKQKFHPHLPIACAVGISNKHLLSAKPSLQVRGRTVSLVLQKRLARKHRIPSNYSCLLRLFLHKRKKTRISSFYVLLSIRLIRRRRAPTRTMRRVHIPTPTRSHTRMETPILRLIIQI